MAKIINKTIKTNYKYVWGRIYYDKVQYTAAVCGILGRPRDTEREAAKDVDMILIRHGKDPIHILKKKTINA